MNKRLNKILGGFVAGASAFALAACLLPVGNGVGLTASGDVPPPDTNLTYVQAQIFSKKCADCHGGSTPALGLNLSSVAATKASIYNSTNGTWRLSLVASSTQPRFRIKGGTLDSTGKVTSTTGASADSSYIYQKVSSDTPKSGGRMPLGRANEYLTTAELGLLRAWIEKGASLE